MDDLRGVQAQDELSAPTSKTIRLGRPAATSTEGRGSATRGENSPNEGGACCVFRRGGFRVSKSELTFCASMTGDERSLLAQEVTSRDAPDSDPVQRYSLAFSSRTHVLLCCGWRTRSAASTRASRLHNSSSPASITTVLRASRPPGRAPPASGPTG